MNKASPRIVSRSDGLGPMNPISGGVLVAARMVLETVAFWAVHRHWDPSPQSIEEGAVEEAVIDLLTHSLMRE